MKKYIFKFTILLIVLAGSISSCEKNNDLDMSNIENLYAQPLPVIQKCVQGKWKWITYYSGASGGWIPIDNGLVEITEDKIISYKGIQEFSWKKQEVEASFGTIQTYVAWERQNNVPICFFQSIKNDTMKVTGFMFSPYNHEFIRIINDNY